ncbi:MAG TPA: serine/threonine-protein kinase [Polyangiales bacterium]|nr:serine/threonine-protein kinase [Polyangiales bacterium]
MNGPLGSEDDWTGRILGGQFRLLRVLGRGGMGHVYLAEQLEVGRHVVIKVLNSSRLLDPNHEARFQREARALAQLSHPNIVHLYMFGRTDDGTPFLAMEYVEGRTLASVIEESGAQPERRTLEILDQVCSALVEAHRQGVVHRDLKPENVMISARHGADVRVKILDFGIAKLAHAAEAKLTRKGEVLGTPLYMAPEQLREQTADARTDIYALGAIGFELLTGEVPYEAETTLSLMVKVLNETMIPLRERAQGVNVSPATDALITRCLAKEPSDRFQTAVELRVALTKQLEQLSRTLLGAAGAYAATATALSLRPADELARVPDAEEWVVQRARRRKLRIFWLGMLLLSAALMLAFVPRWLAQRNAADERQTADAELAPIEELEWVQGIPFPTGTDFRRFEALEIDARVPANVERTLAFYHRHLDNKWGRARSLPQGLEFADPQAPITQLTVAPARDGSRVVITRRALAPKP